jgi:hypothetical protein
VRTIAKARRTTVSAINEAIDRWAASVIDDKIRKNALALSPGSMNCKRRFTRVRSMATCSVPSRQLRQLANLRLRAT